MLGFQKSFAWAVFHCLYLQPKGTLMELQQQPGSIVTVPRCRPILGKNYIQYMAKSLLPFSYNLWQVSSLLNGLNF